MQTMNLPQEIYLRSSQVRNFAADFMRGFSVEALLVKETDYVSMPLPTHVEIESINERKIRFHHNKN